MVKLLYFGEPFMHQENCRARRLLEIKLAVLCVRIVCREVRNWPLSTALQLGINLVSIMYIFQR